MDWNIPSINETKAIVIIAHPDDETIFCGGTILRYSHWRWTVYCLTAQKETERGNEFMKAMEMYKAMGVNDINFVCLEQEDKQEDPSKGDIQQWDTVIRDLDIRGDLILTHNAIGEYGHPQHKILNKISNELYKNVWEIICPGARNFLQPTRSKINQIKLEKDVLTKKCKIFNE